jgi:hypothetical protein
MVTKQTKTSLFEQITGTNTPPHQKQTIQTGGNNNNSSGMAGGKSWSSVTGGNKRQGGFLDQKSPFFQEEFPKLAMGVDEKSPGPKKEEESKELPYGPGPSLRPQSKSML